jgi:hypothetical protein
VAICSIDDASEVDLYTFSAQVDDILFVRAYRTSNTLQPWVRVYNPDGGLQCQWYGSRFIEGACTLPIAGTYTLRFSDASAGANQTGAYRLFIQRLNQPGGAAAMPFGELVTNTIGEATEVDTYTFPGAVDDRLLVRMHRKSNTLQPWIRIYTPSGSLRCQGFASRFVEIGCTLTVAGTYTMLVTDATDPRDQTGDYTLLVQRLNAPLVVTPVSYGQRIAASIATPTEFDSFTVNGEVDETLVIRMHRRTNTVQPWFRLYNPTGDLVCQGYGQRFVETFCSLAVTGRYTIIAADASDPRDLTGDYVLYVQRLQDPGEAIAMEGFGFQQTGSISDTAEVDTFTFMGEVDDRIFVRMRRTSNVLQPWVRIYTPNGGLLCQGYGARLFETVCTLPQAGRYTALVADASDGRLDTGNYSLYFQRLNNPGAAQVLSGRGAVNGVIDEPFKVATYAMSGQVDDQIALSMVRTSNTLQPWIRVYNPSGELLCQGYGATRAEIDSCTLSRNGTYTILLSDASNGRIETGGYSLNLDCLRGSCISAPAPFGTRVYLPLLRR